MNENDEKEEVEWLLKENPSRFVVLPVQHYEIWRMYKQHLASFWTLDEIDLASDKKDWVSLNEDEKHFIKIVLAFFAASDGIVLENLAERFLTEVQIPEIRCFYGFQIAMENIHSETYCQLIETYVDDPKERKHLLNAIAEVESV